MNWPFKRWSGGAVWPPMSQNTRGSKEYTERKWHVVFHFGQIPPPMLPFVLLVLLCTQMVRACSCTCLAYWAFLSLSHSLAICSFAGNAHSHIVSQSAFNLWNLICFCVFCCFILFLSFLTLQSMKSPLWPVILSVFCVSVQPLFRLHCVARWHSAILW